MELQERIERLESRESIRTLVADYSMAVDDRDVDTIGTLFAENGIFGHADGSAVMHGRQAIVDFYNGRLGDMGPTYHYPHSHKITFTDANTCLLYTSPSPRDAHESRMPSSA